MLRHKKNLQQQRKETVMIQRKKKMIDRKEKMIERREKVKDKQKQNIGEESTCDWETLPEDIKQKIAKCVDFPGQRRLAQVNKSWRSIVFQILMPSVCCQLPWLILPESTSCKINKYLSFLTFPDNKLSKGKVVKLKLPKELQGGWIYGSSKGWLIIINEKESNSEMCLLNSMQGSIHNLPPLRSIPSFNKFVKTKEWKRLGAKGLCTCVRMSINSEGSNSSSSFIVAAIFNDRKTLGLCRPGDKKWSVFPVLDCLLDLLFSSGTLYALVMWSKRNSSSVPPIQPLNFAYHDAQHLKLKLVVDKQEYENVGHWSMLVESTNKEVLLINQLNDYVVKTKNDVDEQNQQINEEDIDGVEGNNNDESGGGDGGDEVVNVDTQNLRLLTRKFITYKINPENNNLHMMQSLGDQLFFYGNDGAFSLPASNIKEIENNCIYFAMNLYRMKDLEWLPKTYMTDEFGIFYLDGERTERPFQGMEMSAKYQASWFTPSL